MVIIGPPPELMSRFGKLAGSRIRSAGIDWWFLNQTLNCDREYAHGGVTNRHTDIIIILTTYLLSPIWSTQGISQKIHP